MATAIYQFDSLTAAAEALVVVLEDARESDVYYKFSPLSAREVLDRGLSLTGDIEIVTEKLDEVAGAARF
jgi:hypothetical protein